MVQDPFQLAAGIVSIRDQTGTLHDLFLHTIPAQIFDPVCRAAALPNDRIVHRLASLPIPDDRCLPLVGDAYGRNIAIMRPQLSHGFHSHRKLCGPDLHWIVLHPARLRIDLRKLLLRCTANIALLVK